MHIGLTVSILTTMSNLLSSHPIDFNPDDEKPNGPSPPFNAGDANIIVVSSDGHMFALHTFILSLASVVFQEMFSAPVPAFEPSSTPVLASTLASAASPEHKDYHNGRPIVHLTEDHRTLEMLFRLIYPVDNPTLSTVSDILKMIRALDKYIVEGFSRTIEEALVGIVEKAPHVVWALARRQNLPELVEKALLCTLKHPIVVPRPSISDEDLQGCMTAVELRALQLWHKRCSETVMEEINSVRWMTEGLWVPPTLTRADPDCTCNRTTVSLCVGISNRGNEIHEPFHVANWVKGFVDRCKPRLRETPHWDTIGKVPTHPSLSEVSKCPNCAASGADVLGLVIVKTISRIQTAVRRVNLLAYCTRHDTLTI